MNSIPLHWRLRKQKYALVGTKCQSCKGLFFPAKNYCGNCNSKDMEGFRFSGFGTIESFTTIHAAPSGFKAPYAVAVVKLDEGPKVVAQVVAGNGVSVGRRVSAVFRKIRDNDESDVIKYGFKFEVL